LASKELRAIEGVNNFGSHIGRAKAADEVYGRYFTQLWISIDPDVDNDETVAKIQAAVDGYSGLKRDLLTNLTERIQEVLTGSGGAIVVRFNGPEGVGFPILRCVTLISLYTGLLFDLACGPYSSKQTGETALMRELLDELRPGDTLVADSYHCMYWLVAACRIRKVHIVMKNHHKRENDPADARRLRKGERLVTWKRPVRPTWMSVGEYQLQPGTIEIRLVDVNVDRAGFRPDQFTVATTCTNVAEAGADWIRSVYESRWLVELDIRAVKCSLHMDILRVRTPAMVLKELWSCLLAYYLIRLKMLQSCTAQRRDPRSLSFTTAQQLLATNWLLCAVIGVTDELRELGQQACCSERVGRREGRVEPRRNKRRPTVLALMTMPRYQYHDELKTAA